MKKKPNAYCRCSSLSSTMSSGIAHGQLPGLELVLLSHGAAAVVVRVQVWAKEERGRP
jgi:hypothetical protein